MGVAPSKKTRLSDLSCGINIWTISFFRYVTNHEFERLIDGRTDSFLVASPCWRSMQLGKRQNKLITVVLLANVNSSLCSLYVIDGPSVCRLSSVVCLSSVTLVRPTQAIEIFGNISTPCGTFAIHELCIKILRRSSQGNPSVGGVKHKRGSRI